MRKDIFENEEEARQFWLDLYPECTEGEFKQMMKRTRDENYIKKSELERARENYHNYVNTPDFDEIHGFVFLKKYNIELEWEIIKLKKILQMHD